MTLLAGYRTAQVKRAEDTFLSLLDQLIEALQAVEKSTDFAGLRILAEARKDRFAFGVVHYDSADLVPFGDKLAAAS